MTDKVLPILIGISGTAASWCSNDTTTPVLGFPATTVVAGAVGALIALAYDSHTKDRPDGKRYAQAAGAGVTGATLSGLAPAYGGVDMVCRPAGGAGIPVCDRGVFSASDGYPTAAGTAGRHRSVHPDLAAVGLAAVPQATSRTGAAGASLEGRNTMSLWYLLAAPAWIINLMAAMARLANLGRDD